MKRSMSNLRSPAEQRLDNARHLNMVEREGKKQPQYKSIFTERPHYGIAEPVKEEVDAERN